MYASAVLTGLTALVIILVAPSVGVIHIFGRAVLESHTRQVVRTALGGAAESAVWLWMAWKNKIGRAWARELSTGLFLLCCLSTFFDLRTGEAGVIKPLQVAIWLVALAATIQIRLPESGRFYQR